jgi:hypothetical protein
MTGTLHEDQYTFLIICRSVLLRMRNVSDKSCRENRNTRFTFSNLFPKSCLLWANVEAFCRAGQATWQHGALVLRAGFLRLHTQTQNIILTAFLMQQWLQERTSLLRRTYIACLVSLRFLSSTMYASPHTCYMPHPSHPRFYQPNNIIIFVEEYRQ